MENLIKLGKRLAVNPKHVIAVVLDDKLNTAVVSLGLIRKSEYDYETTVRLLNDEKVEPKK